MLNLYKPVGVTPFELISTFKENFPQYKDKKLAYAGRLDPMADGVIIVLEKEELKKRSEFQRLPKKYKAEILLGIETDTYDPLGIITNSMGTADVNHKLIISNIKSLVGQKMQEYPPYSSPRVKGKPLFWWAREGKLTLIKIPEKQIEIYSIKVIETRQWSASKLCKFAIERIPRVSGNFRQAKILKHWQKLEKIKKDKIFTSFTIEVSCSSGTYIRSLAHELGKKVNTGAIALTITRTSVGKFTLKDSRSVENAYDQAPANASCEDEVPLG